MRTFALIMIAALFLTACNKDKFTTVPQIKFKSVSPDTYRGGVLPSGSVPVMKLHITDAEGDLGFINGKDTSWFYIKNLRTGDFDSATLPDISKGAVKKFTADLEIDMARYLRVPNLSKKDTLYFEMYVKDFAKNKSNVIRNDNPIYYIP